MKKKTKPAMQTVHKFRIAPQVEMPEGATILKVGFDPSIPAVCLWALCAPTAPKETRFFAMAKTGEELAPAIDDCPHLETLIVTVPGPDGGLKTQVTHVWEVPAYLAKPPKKGDEWKHG
jgi:hypothetical protein